MKQAEVRKLVKVRGVVQGVGFRPFIYNLAQEYDVTGRVQNTTQGVEIDVQGSLRGVTYFIHQIKTNPPSLAQIEEIIIRQQAPTEYQQFTIQSSQDEAEELTFVAPDAALCAQCEAELLNSQDRRYHYPFINCTNCGPRFSIIKNLPYDRSATTMAEFTMCEQCSSEYQDPSSRRFHAQPNACPDCGPKLWLIDKAGRKLTGNNPLQQVIKFLRRGRIVAVKGLGGFHLLCDGTNPQAVTRLRVKKKRPAKALAVLMRDLKTVERYCRVTAQEAEILQGQRRPILLLKKQGQKLPQGIAPDTNYLGVMLPYTPLHLLLTRGINVVVATSGNLSGLPLEYTNQGAEAELTQIADYCLMHNRKIEVPVDDAVVKTALGRQRVIRQGRGFAPQVIKSKSIKAKTATLACGSDLKNTFCLAKGEFAFLSQYTGSLSNLETYQRYQSNIAHLQQLYHIDPALIVHDVHEGYYSTQYAQQLTGKKVAVQHHHAHLVSCMVEHQLQQPVIGVAFDGLGLGTDGHLWGGEFFICDYCDFTRVGHIQYAAQPGGDQAVKEPWRMAVSYLQQAGIAAEIFTKTGLQIQKDKLAAVEQMLEQDINCPRTSSLGRLFAAVAALLGLCLKRSYQGQAALKLETAAQAVNTNDSYNYQISKQAGQYLLVTKPLITEIAADLTAEVKPELIARKFHNTVIDFSVRLCEILRLQFKLEDVVLSGGVWQNQILLTEVYRRLTAGGFKVHLPQKIPCTDEGLAVGQLAVANYQERGRL